MAEESFDFYDLSLAHLFPKQQFLADSLVQRKFDGTPIFVRKPEEDFRFFHETAIIAYHNVLYLAYYQCPKEELKGNTPICFQRSFDGGKGWSEPIVLCQDPTGERLYCPPVFGICDDKLYLMVNQMVAPDHIHSLDLYEWSEETESFELLWSRPIPFKLNTNPVRLKNGKLALPGRVGELDSFPNTPALLLSDSGKMDGQWRLVKVAENGDLPDGTSLFHPEVSLCEREGVLYLFCRNDYRNLPLVYLSKDLGEHWSLPNAHDLPLAPSKLFAGNLSDGRICLVANADHMDRSKLCVYLTASGGILFEQKIVLFDEAKSSLEGVTACHYPAFCEWDGKLYLSATVNYDWVTRGVVLFILPLNEI